MIAYRWRQMMHLGRLEPAIGPPVFIVGCGHSGTTLVLAMLNAHSRIHGIPYETGFIDQSVPDREWFVHRFNRDARAAGKPRWVEKTPRHVHHIDALLRRFPNGRVIVVVRDGRDVACSFRDRFDDFAGGVQRWLDDNAAAEPFRAHPAVRFVRYEDLIGEREATLRDLVGFLGEEFEPLLLAHHTAGFRFYGRFQQADRFAAQIEQLDDKPASVSGADHRLYRSWQSQQEVFDGRGRWRTDLSDDEQAQFKELAGSRLVAYGYAADNSW